VFSLTEVLGVVNLAFAAHQAVPIWGATHVIAGSLGIALRRRWTMERDPLFGHWRPRERR